MLLKCIPLWAKYHQVRSARDYILLWRKNVKTWLEPVQHPKHLTSSYWKHAQGPQTFLFYSFLCDSLGLIAFKLSYEKDQTMAKFFIKSHFNFSWSVSLQILGQIENQYFCNIAIMEWNLKISLEIYMVWKLLGNFIRYLTPLWTLKSATESKTLINIALLWPHKDKTFKFVV